MIYAHIIHGVTFPRFWGWVGFFIPLEVRVGGTVDMRTGLRSFWALGWCLDGGDLGRGREAVAIWGFAEQSKRNS